MWSVKRHPLALDRADPVRHGGSYPIGGGYVARGDDVCEARITAREVTALEQHCGARTERAPQFTRGAEHVRDGGYVIWVLLLRALARMLQVAQEQRRL